MHRRLLAPLLLVVLPGCPLLEVEVDAPEVRLTYPGVAVPAADAAPRIQSTFTFDDLSAIQELGELDAGVAFVRGEARIASGLDDFSFVDAVTLSIASGDPASTLAPLTLYACDGDCPVDGASLDLPADVEQAVLPYVTSGSIAITVDLAGALPAHPWTMDVDVYLTANGAYSASP
jgi:hypothetical protein